MITPLQPFASINWKLQQSPPPNPLWANLQAFNFWIKVRLNFQTLPPPPSPQAKIVFESSTQVQFF